MKCIGINLRYLLEFRFVSELSTYLLMDGLKRCILQISCLTHLNCSQDMTYYSDN